LIDGPRVSPDRTRASLAAHPVSLMHGSDSVVFAGDATEMLVKFAKMDAKIVFGSRKYCKALCSSVCRASGWSESGE
jgi:hypothetical protein